LALKLSAAFAAWIFIVCSAARTTMRPANAAVLLPGDRDLTVAHVQHQDGTSRIWAVFRLENVLVIERTVEGALEAARRIARADGCGAWLLGGAEPVAINLDVAGSTN
jgi:hypothetical protein